MLLHDASRLALTSRTGELVLLDEQHRALWNRAQTSEGSALVEPAIASRRLGPYTVQAAIAAVHAEAREPRATDREEIVALWDVLLVLMPSPIVESNRAAGIAMRDGPAAGLVLIHALLGRGELRNDHLAHAARADICRRLGRLEEPLDAYARARELAVQEPERRFLERRLKELGAPE